MKWMIAIATIGIPILFFVVGRYYKTMVILFNALAALCMIIFGIISANAVYAVIRDNTVFMTNIHAIFLNPWFLFSGAYLGNYLIYRVIILLMTEK